VILREMGVDVLLWPYLLGSEEAPATAKRGEEKNVLRAASISASHFCPRVAGIEEAGRWVQIFWV